MDKNILQIDGLSKYFGGLAAVSDCSIKIKKGSITGVIGPNGSGNTTLFLALSEDAVKNSKKDLKYLVKESQTAKGLNEQGVKELKKSGFYKKLEKTLNNIHKRLDK